MGVKMMKDSGSQALYCVMSEFIFYMKMLQACSSWYLRTLRLQLLGDYDFEVKLANFYEEICLSSVIMHLNFFLLLDFGRESSVPLGNFSSQQVADAIQKISQQSG